MSRQLTIEIRIEPKLDHQIGVLAIMSTDIDVLPLRHVHVLDGQLKVGLDTSNQLALEKRVENQVSTSQSLTLQVIADHLIQIQTSFGDRLGDADAGHVPELLLPGLLVGEGSLDRHELDDHLVQHVQKQPELRLEQILQLGVGLRGVLRTIVSANHQQQLKNRWLEPEQTFQLLLALLTGHLPSIVLSLSLHFESFVGVSR